MPGTLRWLRQRDLPSLAADLLTRVNELIDDHDAHIGPSYLMHTDQSQERLRRVFRTQIEPLLRETYYDRWSTLGSRFDFGRLWKEIGQSTASAVGDEAGTPAAATSDPVASPAEGSQPLSPPGEGTEPSSP